jgi:sec-independent protein translocase protein TatA
MFGFGVPELIIIAVIVIMIFGVGKLPEIGNSFGRAISNFKKSVNDEDKIEINPKDDNKTDDVA